jgi:GNAT superfamily N-acetyltransferase
VTGHGPAQDDLLHRIERCYDAIPTLGGARAEQIGPLVLFVPDGPGWGYYCRPRLDAGAVSTADVDAVRHRQRALGVPEAFEWVHEITPSMLEAVRGSGIEVLLAPLMVLEPAGLPDPGSAAAGTVRVLDPHAPDFLDEYALAHAVASVGFGTPGTAPGQAGPVERDTAFQARDPDRLAASRDRLDEHPLFAQAVAETADGIVATGALQGGYGCAEVVGVATLPVARRRGLAASVTAALARYALDHGAQIVFLSAMDADVARMYGGIGFHQVGTACIAEARPSTEDTPGSSTEDGSR